MKFRCSCWIRHFWLLPCLVEKERWNSCETKQVLFSTRLPCLDIWFDFRFKPDRNISEKCMLQILLWYFYWFWHDHKQPFYWFRYVSCFRPICQVSTTTVGSCHELHCDFYMLLGFGMGLEQINIFIRKNIEQSCITIWTKVSIK